MQITSNPNMNTNYTSATRASGPQWEEYTSDHYRPSSESVTIYKRPAAAPVPASQPRPWMMKMSELPGINELRLDGADLHVTPTQDFAGRALANLLSPEVDGYQVLVDGSPGPLQQREALIFLRDLPGVQGDLLPTVTGSSIVVTTTNSSSNELYKSVLGNPRGLDLRIEFRNESRSLNSVNYRD